LDDPAAQNVSSDPQLALQLDRALTMLEQQNTRAAQIVELHYFAGLELQQVADILGVTRRTVDRRWSLARALLAGYV